MPVSGSMLVVDNGSSYTDDLAAVLEEFGCTYRRMIPSEISAGELPAYGGFILSGRKRNDRLVNEVNSKIVRHAVSSGAKLLGICYGAEIMALCMGGTIRRSEVPQRNVRCTVVVSKSTPITPDAGASMDVFESHAYEISRLPRSFESVGGSADCRHEIIRYGGSHVYGTQFHPEMSRDGRRMVERFCGL